MSTQDEGWWRIAFDRCGVPYDYISVHVIAQTPDLRSRWDVLVLAPIRSSLSRFINGIQTADAIPWKPSEKYPNLGGPDQTDDIRGGIGFEGLAHLRRFVEGGGLLLAAPSLSGPRGPCWPGRSGRSHRAQGLACARRRLSYYGRRQR